MALSTSDPNLGLLDLLNSLKAIQSHVELFGGDPLRVTIGGQSSGAGMIRCELIIRRQLHRLTITVQILICSFTWCTSIHGSVPRSDSAVRPNGM